MRLLLFCLVPVLYVAVAAVRSSGGAPTTLSALVLLPLGLAVAFRLTEPRTIGEDLVGDEARTAFRLALVGGAIFAAARGPGPGRAAFDAAAAIGVGLACAAALHGLSRVPEGRGLLSSDPAARRLDAPVAALLVAVVSATVPAAAFLLPSKRGAIDPLTIDYAMVAEGAGLLLLLTLASLRFRLLRRLELGVVDRGSAALAISLTALLTSAPASMLGFAAPDRALPASALLASMAVALVVVIPDATAVSRSLRTLLVVCVVGSPVALFTAGVAAAAPKQAGGAVLLSSVLLLLIGTLAGRVSSRFLPDATRWLGALGKAQESASTPDPALAISSALSQLQALLGPSSPSPALYRLETGDVLTVDRAGYLHEAVGSLPADLLDFCDAEPQQTFRLEVARAIQVRRPDVRNVLAWMEAHGYACATALRDEEGPVGVLAMPRGRRRVSLTLEEVLSLGRLAERLGSVFSLSSAMTSARKRQLDAEAEGRRLTDSLAQARNALSRQGERFAAQARLVARGAPLGRYSPASRLVDQEIERAARGRGPLVLLAPPGVPAEAFAAAAHLQGERRDGPFILVDGSDPREHPMTRWFDQVTSPPLLAHGGTLVILDLPVLPPDVQRFVARLLADPASHDWRAPWLDAPSSLDFFLIVSVRETVDTLVARDRLTEELANELGDRAIPLPSLASRPEDLRAIALDRLSRLGFALRGSPVGIADDALALLLEQPFLLNDAELELILHRSLLTARGPALRAADVEPHLPASSAPPGARSRRK